MSINHEDSKSNLRDELIMFVMAVGFIACLFFWVSSCQQTDLIKACLQSPHAKEVRDCMNFGGIYVQRFDEAMKESAQ